MDVNEFERRMWNVIISAFSIVTNGVAVINGIVYSVTRNTMTMPNNMFYRGLTWDEEMIEHLNVIRDINK